MERIKKHIKRAFFIEETKQKHDYIPDKCKNCHWLIIDNSGCSKFHWSNHNPDNVCKTDFKPLKRKN